MRPKVVVALLIAVGAGRAPDVARAADPAAEVVTRGIRWLSLPQEADIEVTYRVRESERVRDLALTCVFPFGVAEPGRGTLDERLEPVRGGLIGVGFGAGYSHEEYQSGKEGSLYTTMEATLPGPRGTLSVHCEEPRLSLSGIGHVVIYLHKKGHPEKPISNQIVLRVAADDESKKQLQQRYGPALEATTTPAAAPPPAAATAPAAGAGPTSPPVTAETPRPSE